MLLFWTEVSIFSYFSTNCMSLDKIKTEYILKHFSFPENRVSFTCKLFPYVTFYKKYDSIFLEK